MAMLSVGWLFAEVPLEIPLTIWVTTPLNRRDRLHARVDAAQAALDAQLVRRAAALQHLAEVPGNGVPDELADRPGTAARTALAVPHAGPAHLNPAHLDPAHLDPAHLDPAHLDPAHLDPAVLDP